MASGSLAYRHHADLETDLTKFGFLVYGGTVRDFHEWEFRAMTRWTQTKDDEKKDLASKFLDSLRGEAYIAAEDLGAEVLGSKDNIPKVIEKVRTNLFPLQEQESKELYRLGTQIGGMLSRQAGEPMTSYLSRRSRWWRKMKQLDKTVSISESILTDLLLDNAGINRQERIMVITAMAGSVKTEDCEKALIKMHSRIHLLEKKNPSPFGKGKGKPYSGKGKKGKAHKGAQYSYLSAVEELFDATEDDGEDYACTADAYAADADQENDWVYPGGDDSYADWGEETALVAQTADASLRDVELDVLTAFLGTEGFNSEDRERLYAETMAFMARSKAKGKGKPTSKSAHSYRPRPSNLSVEDRRKKLQEIKSKSTCKVCGRRGHWAGDKECPGKQATSSGGASAAFVAQVVRTEEKGTQTDTWGRKASDTSDDSDERFGYLSVANDMGRVAYMGFFDDGDFEESDEELEADSALSSAWSYVDYPEGGDIKFNFGMHKGQTYMDCLREHPDYYHWGLSEKNPSPQLEAYLRWVFKNFDVPPAGAGRPVQRDRPVADRDCDLDVARSLILSGRKTKSKLSMMKQADEPCRGGCPERAISRAGSNAHVMKTTCMICGHKTSVPRPKVTPTKATHECAHERVDFRYSTRSVHKVYCLDCDTIVEETPQRVHKMGKELASQVKSSSLKQQDLTRRQLDEVELTRMEAGDVIKKFVKYWDKRLCRVDAVTSTELSSVLEDFIDECREAQGESAAGDATEGGHGRCVSGGSCAEKDYAAVSDDPSVGVHRNFFDPSGDIHMALSDHAEEQVSEPTLPLLDPLEDHDNIWVMLDEGCNTTCHGRKWRQNAEATLAKHGLKLLKVSSEGGAFRGIGSSRCSGKYKLPFALGLRPQGTLNGDLESSELENDEVLCLLSLQDQTQLGLVKDLRAGRVTLKDYPDVWLPVARHVRTGLILLNISSFGKDPNRHHRAFALRPRSPCKLLKGKPTPGRGGQEESTHQVGDQSAYMTGGTTEASSCKCRKVHFYTFGLEKLEFSKKSYKRSKALTDLFQTFSQRGKSYDFTLDSEEHEQKLLTSLRENFPFVKELDTKQILFVDCRATGDPASNKSLRDHLGVYPLNLQHMTTNPKWLDWWKEVVPSAHRLLTEVEEAYVFVFCKSGRHRSVANGDMLYRAIFDLYDVEAVEIDHFCDGPNWRHTCGGLCQDCKWDNPETSPLAEEAVRVSQQIWKDVMLENGVTLPGGNSVTVKPGGITVDEVKPEPSSGSRDKPGDSSGSTDRPKGDPSEGTDQSVDVDKKKAQHFKCWDLRSSMVDMSDDQLKKTAFLFLSRIYSVFDPPKQEKVTELIAKYELDLRTLVGAVSAKYLDLAQAQSLFESLRDSVLGGKRTELGWKADLEEANRSLDQALAYMEADDKDDKAEKERLKEALDESRKKKSESERDRTRTPTREPAPTDKGKGVGDKGKATGKGKGAQKGKKGKAEHEQEDHPEARQDLLDLNEDVSKPHHLTDRFLHLVVDGHKSFQGGGKGCAFKAWLQNRRGPTIAVRVSFRRYPRNSWDKHPAALARYTKYTCAWWPNSGLWRCVEEGVAADKWTFFDDPPERMLVFLVPPRQNTAYFVGGLPDLSGSKLKVMPTSLAKSFEDSSKNLGTHDEMLFRALGLQSTGDHSDLKIYVLANSSFQPGSLERTGATVMVRHPGHKIILLEDIGWTKQISKEIAKVQPDLLLLVYEGLEDCTELSPAAQSFLDGFAACAAKEVLVLDSVSSVRWKYLEASSCLEEGEREVQVYFGRGDLGIGTTSQALGEVLVDWADNDHSVYYSPVSVDTVGDHEGFAECVVAALLEVCVEENVASAFPVEARQEEVEEAGTMDAVVDQRDNRTSFMDEEEAAAEADFLDTLPLAGFPKEESERRREWAKVPRRVRLGIRRLHNMMSHKPKEVMIQVLRGAGASEELINAAKVFRCETCRVSDESVRTHPVNAPPPYEFNHTVSVDVFETSDSVGEKYSWLNIVDNGTCYQVVALVRVGGGQPSSAKCLQKFMKYWASPFGWPKVITHDRGLHNRGAFAYGLAAHGVLIRQAGLESPEHIGRCERHGGILKRAFRRIVRQHNLAGKTEVKEAMLEGQVSKNEFLRVGGFAPVQWVLGRLPRGVGHVLDEDELGQLGVLSARMDPTTAFGRRAEFRHTARKAFVKQDCSRRVRSAILRKAAPLPGRYQAGDLVCYRISREEHHGVPSWSAVAKVIGVDGKTVWVVHQGVPVATSLGRLRPCTAAEVLAYQVLNRGNIRFEHADAEREQRRYVDATEDIPTGDLEAGDTAGEPSITIPAATLPATERAVRRRVGPREESRAVTLDTVEEPEVEETEAPDAELVPAVDQEAQESIAEATMESSIDTGGSDTSLHASIRAYASHFWSYKEAAIWDSLPGEKEYEELRVFLADRWDQPTINTWKKRRKNYTGKKQKEKNGKLLVYAKCSPEVQAELDKTREKEWNKWKEFSAAVVIDKNQLEELIREGHQIIPTQWVEVDKHHAQRLADPTVEAKYKSRLVVRGDLEQGEIIDEFKCGTVESDSFRYCGKEVKQDEDYNIHITCGDTTRTIKKIPIAPRRRPGDPLTDSDRTQMKSVAGSLAWVCRQCRPDLSYRVSRIQSASNSGTVADIKEANKTVEYAVKTYERGITFRSGLLDWSKPGGLMSLVITDASHANEEEELLVNGSVSVEHHRSQGARMIFVATPSLWDQDKGSVHPIAWASNIVRRVCRSTIQAEAYTLQAGVEDGDVIRAAVADLFGVLDLKRWEASAAKFMKQIWFTDCKSLEETLMNPKCSKHSDKRLSIEIASLRQDLWRKKGEKAGDPYEEDYRPSDESLTDTVRWIDTDVMVADPLTKVMEPTKLVHVMETNELDVKQPIDSIVKKRAKQLQRRKGNPAEADPKEDG
ncbi:GIP [Symbiodinium sp. CCMP2592]|nr:GIP [Symbiodinium sp. CCMP2592]